MKCADDMTDDSPYRCGAEQLSLWCNQNNLELNMLRNVETSVGAVQHHPPLASRCRYTLRNSYRQFHLYSLLRHCSIADIRGEVKTRCKDIFLGGGVSIKSHIFKLLKHIPLGNCESLSICNGTSLKWR